VHVDRVCSDRWGVEVDFTIIPTPGLVKRQATGLVGSRVNVDCCWELFHTERSGWHSSGQGSWSLFFDLRLIEEVVQLGTALHGKVDRSERFRILRTRLSRALVEDLRCLVAVESLWSPVRTVPQNDKITFEFNSTRKR
jgi:hypothetical protein